MVFRLLVARPETKLMVRVDYENKKLGSEKSAVIDDEKDEDEEELEDSDDESGDEDSEKETAVKKGKGKDKLGDGDKEFVKRVMTKAKSIGRGVPRYVSYQPSSL